MEIHPDEKVQALVEKIDESYANGMLEEFDKLNEQLLEYATKEKDELAKFIYEYNLLNHDFDAHKFDICEKVTLDLIDKFLKYDAMYYVLRCYNTMGIIESERANYYECLGYYIKSLQIAEKHPDFQFSAIIANNIGNVFVWLNEFEPAVSYLLQAYDFYLKENRDDPRSGAVIIINLIECYGCLGQYEESEKWYQKTFKYTEIEYCVRENLHLCNEIEVKFQQHDTSDIYDLYDRVLENVKKYDEYIYHFRTLLRVLKVCVALKHRTYCKHLMSIMEVLNKNCEITSFSFDYAEIKMDYYFTYRHLNDEDFSIYCDEYFKQSSLSFHLLQKTYTQSMVLRLDLEKIKDERQLALHKNEQLERNLELDPFTKVYNKNGLKKKGIELLQLSEDYQKHAMFVIDVDHFKNVNDVFGHKIGDEVLLRVAKLLQSIEDDNILVGRFGGDEFIVFYYDYPSIDKIHDLAKSLVDRAKKIIITTTSDDHITFSIGVCTKNGKANFESMFYNADKVLYDCKKQGRNGYRIFQS
ncbi:MAG: tetratricopeptide repeat-containing diguanylate cyclase [Longicatena sp.]